MGRDLGVGMDQGGDCPCPLGPEEPNYNMSYKRFKSSLRLLFIILSTVVVAAAVVEIIKHISRSTN
jgi:hypothetical protein